MMKNILIMMKGELMPLSTFTFRLEKYFGTEGFRADMFNEEDINVLHTQLTAIIAAYLDNNIEKILQLLYRIDVDEYLLKKAMSDAHPAASIAQLIINREMQKARSRAFYRQF